jgi:nitrite reductase/ring-hydroxylating ferredoxin subunit
MTNGTAAAMILSDRLLGRDNPWARLFDSTRLGSVLTKKLLSENFDAVRHLLEDRLVLPGAEALKGLEPGEGIVLRLQGKNLAVSKDASGQLLAVSAVCTHVGCLVSWNPAELSWDCPCHGSRYLPDGTVIEGPAVKDLEPAALPGSTPTGP